MQREFFTEVVIGSVHNRNTIVPLSSVAEYLKIAQRAKQPLFKSYYKFPEAFKVHVNKEHSVGGYRGLVYLDKVLLDIDKGDDKDVECLDRARAFVTRINDDYNIPQEDIRIFFSGRGYHIVLPDHFGFEPSPNLSQLVSETLTAVFPEADNIFDKTRIIRVANSMNEKTNLYKINLSWEEFFGMEVNKIIELAAEPREQAIEPFGKVELLLAHFLQKTEKSVDKQGVKIVVGNDYTRIATCAHKMWNDLRDVEGDRHQKMMRISSAWRRNSMPPDAIQAAFEHRLPSMSKDDITKIVAGKQYEFGCQDKYMKAYCDPRCVFYSTKKYGNATKGIEQLEKEFGHFLSTDFTESSFNLGELYDTKEPFWIYPGEFVSVIGDTGRGKTAIVQNWMVHFNHLKLLALSLEVGQNLFFRRLIQIAHKMTKTEVIKYYQKNSNHLSDAVKHVRVSMQSPTLDTLRAMILDNQPNVVVIDTIEDLDIRDAKDATAITDAAARNLQRLAEEMKIIVIVIHHISKSAALDQEGQRRSLTQHSGKGSSAVEQKADKLIAVEGEADSPHRMLRSLKARDETPFALSLLFDHETFTFKKLGGSRWEQEELQENTSSKTLSLATSPQEEIPLKDPISQSLTGGLNSEPSLE